MSALRKLVEAAEPGATVGLSMSREWWIRQLDTEASKGNESEQWINLKAAAAILHRKPSGVRASAPGWAAMQAPPVRVRKAGPAPKSPWLFHEGDCWRYRRETGGGPRVADVPVDVAVDERQATVARWAEEAFRTTEATCPASARKNAGPSRSASKGLIA